MLTAKNIRNIAIYAAPLAANVGLSLLALPVLTRILSPEEFGVVTLAWAFPMIAAGVLTCGLSSSVQRYYFEYRTDKAKLDALIGSSQVFLYGMLVLSSIIVFLLREEISLLTMMDRKYGNAVFIAYLAAFFGQVITLYLTLYQNREEAAAFATVTVLQSLLNTGGGLVLVWQFHLSYMGMLYGTLLGNGLVSVVLLALHLRSARLRFDGPVLREALSYGLQIVPKSLTGFINRFFDKYLLNSMLSLSAVGIYNIGQTVGNAMFSLMSTVWSSLQPAYYREVFENGEEGAAQAGRTFTVFTALALFPLLVLLLFAPEIIALLAPPAYGAAVDVIIILLGGTTSQVFGMYVGVQYAVSKKAYWIFPITVAGTLVNIAANIVLIPRYGLSGAAVSTVCMLLLMNTALTVIGQRLHPIRYEWPPIASLFVLIGVSLAAVLLLRSHDPGIAAAYGIKTGLIALYVLLGIRTGIVSRRSIRFITEALPPRKGEAS